MKIIISEDLGISPKFIIEEYIPMKIVIGEIEEPVNYFSYSKEKKSLLEIAVGAHSGRLKKVTLLMSKDYTVFDEKICVNDVFCESANIKLENYGTIECEKFSTDLFEDAIRISLSNESIKKYVKIGRLYIGMPNANEIIEICVMGLSKEETIHIKNELEFQ